MRNNIINIVIDDKDLDKRIDLVISKKVSEISRNRLQKILDQNLVFFNDKIVGSRSFKIKKKGKIKILIPPSKKIDLIAQKIKLKIVFEDKDLVVVDKPPGMVVHPGAGNKTNTLVNALLEHCKNDLSGIGGYERPGIVHRIDKMTSGLIIIAKNDDSHRNLSNQFKNREIKKIYEAFVWNKLPTPEGKINLNIIRSAYNRKKMIVTNNNKGRSAVTTYKLLNEYNVSKNLFISHVQLNIFTGRTHQIRVHMEYLNNCLVGDSTYKQKSLFKNKKKLNELEKKLTDLENSERHALHAKMISFTHPILNKKFEFSTPLPFDLKKLKKTLESNLN